MKSTKALKAVILASICALALVFAVGCSCSAQSSSSSSASGSSSASASSVSASSTSASASSASASSEAASSSAAASSAAASSAAASSTSNNTQSNGAAPANSEQAQPAQDEPNQAAADETTPQGSQVFSGTVYVVSAEELIQLQGVDIDPSVFGSDGTFAVLVFDQPTQVIGMGADGSGERTKTANMLGIAEHTDYPSFVIEYGDLELWKSLNGQHVTVSAQAADIMFPSDVRLPIGEPSASYVTLL